MINYVEVINHSGESLRCYLENPDYSGFSITNIDGLGPGKATLGVHDVATLDGGIFRAAKLPSRNIVIDYIFHDYYGGRWVVPPGGGTPRWIERHRSMEDARNEFYKYFIVKKPVTLIFSTDRHTYKIFGYVESNEPEIFSDMEGAQVSIICPNPYFRLADEGVDESGNISETVFDQGGSFEFPWRNPIGERTIKFSDRDDIHKSVITNINYPGDVDTGVIFHVYVTGHLDYQYLDFEYYGETDEELKTLMRFRNDLYNSMNGGGDHFENGLTDGDELVISTVPGDKYVIVIHNNIPMNAFPCMRLIDDWITMQKGSNVIRVATHPIEPSLPNVYVKMEYPILIAGI